MLQQAKNSEDKAKKAMVDAARLADELRAEQDHTNCLSMSKKSLESQLSELEMKFAEANDNAIRGRVNIGIFWIGVVNQKSRMGSSINQFNSKIICLPQK